ncbi:MAG: NAD(P)/FAD-dependent oxidoreductase [Candidatus Andeanibacterium colombiense]|uniref:NAD(P)/FAD-dependent oxidoreductase n=1 Tax=Candidatus Andeanibacterium colombiense TaxID=3121345 RepID=A0AAJ5XBI8_9SPHN|nr:MAG: NAD(P)/FAD-dependent oxidoreductase [Sphingomonadaceae bacterium]
MTIENLGKTTLYQEAVHQDSPRELDVVIVGAGFAGLYMLHRLRLSNRTAIAIDRGSDVGGTWYWNRYPGARCDVESYQYSYGFSEELDQDWVWTERFAPQTEILSYAQHVADRFDLRRDIRFNRTVESAVFDEAEDLWTVTTHQGDVFRARYCIMATGNLSDVKLPDIAGIGNFAGESYHTGAWPHHPVDFTGKKVGVIGTGSSGIQCIPEIAKQADHLTVFQRTANYSVPACNRVLAEEEIAAIKADYPNMRALVHRTRTGTILPRSRGPLGNFAPAEIEQEFEARWDGEKGGGSSFIAAFDDLLTSLEANAPAVDFVRGKISSIVEDPQVAEDLTPQGYPLGAKRLVCDTGYFATYNRPNVTLVNLRRTPITRVWSDGIETGDVFHRLDALIYATGYDAGTGALNRIDIRGVGGRSLKEKWSAGPKCYLGLMVAGFPSLFVITGPGSPSVLSNVLPSIEFHVEWIDRCLTDLEGRRIEATEAAEDDWAEHVRQCAEQTIMTKADNWYLGANIPGKPRVFFAYAGGVPNYEKKCNAVAQAGYEGFRILEKAACA